MSEFTAGADHYDRFMGRYTASLGPRLIEAAGITPGMTVVDVGCGPGGLTSELSKLVGESNVAAIDPAEQFANACQARNPEADVRVGFAEDLPWDDDSFDAALSSLVIAFMSDADKGVNEMARVTKPGGTIAACMWDLAGGGMPMLNTYWSTAREIDPNVVGERSRPGIAEGDIAERFTRAGLSEVVDGTLEATVAYEDFDDFWQPFTNGPGPAGQHLLSLSPEGQEAQREAVRAKLPSGPFELTGRAWYARGTVAG